MFCCVTKKTKKSPSSIDPTSGLARVQKQAQTSATRKSQYVLQSQREQEDPSTNITNMLSSKEEHNVSMDSAKGSVHIHQQDIIDKVLQLKSRPSPQEEIQFVMKLIQSNLPKVYMLSFDWAQQYTGYLKNEIKIMGEIDNTKLTNSDDLQQDLHYVLVNHQVWQFILMRYGGGPEIKMQVPNSPIIVLDQTPRVQAESQAQGDPRVQPKGDQQPPSDMKIVAYIDDFMKHKAPEERNTYVHILAMPSKQLPIIGLRNPRFFCYINSVLQCLMGIPQLNWFALSIRDAFKQHRKKSLFNYHEFLCSVANAKSCSILSAQGLYPTKFSAYEMHDCQEILLYLLGQWQDELKQPATQPTGVTPTNSTEAFQRYMQLNQTIVDELFVGQFTSTIKCKHCAELSQSYDPFLDISLPIEQNMAPFIPSKTFRETSLMECFKLYFKEETIDGQWECDKCKQRSSKTKRSVQISHTPNILILHLKRFTTRKQKLRDPVSYKTEMDIGMYRIINNRFCAPEVKETRYRLSSMIVHQGGLDSGHYFAMVKKQDKWYIFDDDEVIKVQPKEVTRMTQAYILIYEKY